MPDNSRFHVNNKQSCAQNVLEIAYRTLELLFVTFACTAKLIGFLDIFFVSLEETWDTNIRTHQFTFRTFTNEGTVGDGCDSVAPVGYMCI